MRLVVALRRFEDTSRLRVLSGARRARHAKVQNRSDRGASFIARSAMPPRKKPPTPGSGGKGRQLGLFESFQRDTPSKRRRRSVLSRATIAADILSNSNAHHARATDIVTPQSTPHASGPPAETSTWNTASPGPDTTPSPSSSSRPRAAEAGSTHSARTRKTPDDPKQSSSPRSTSYSATSATRSRRTTSTSASSPSSSARASS